MSQKIGVLSIQGGFEKHKLALIRLGINATYIRTFEELSNIDKIIIPGGESTAIITLLKKHNLWSPLKKFCQTNPVFGTCAGAILLAKKSYGLEKFGDDSTFNAMDIEVKRNSYGRQADSFKTYIDVEIYSNIRRMESIFIRAPSIISIDESKVDVLARLNKEPVLVRQQNLLAATFHPELTDDLSLHSYFVDI